MKKTIRLTTWICILVMLFSALSAPMYASAAEEVKETAAATAEEATPADDAASDSAQKTGETAKKTTKKTTKKKKKKKKKKGNCDKYIGLGKEWMVLATAKRYVTVYKSTTRRSKVLGHFTYNNCIQVATKKMKKGRKYNWLPVYLRNHKIGYIPKKYVSLGKLNIENFGLEPKGKNKKRIKICQYGLPYIGVPFKLGYNSMETAIDCSNFVKRALHSANVKATGFAVDLSNQGKKIKRSQLKPGDTLYYYNNPHDHRIGHSAIYVGGDGMKPGEGYIINASGHQGHVYPTGGLRFSRIDYRKPTAVRFRNFVGN